MSLEKGDWEEGDITYQEETLMNMANFVPTQTKILFSISFQHKGKYCLTHLLLNKRIILSFVANLSKF